MHSLLYVSRRTVCSTSDVADIVAGSRVRNASREITGALVATPHCFAQVLEGSRSAVTNLMDSIRRDVRHTNIVATPVVQRAERDFHGWTLAYHGESSYVAGLIQAMLDAPDFAVEVEAESIRSLMIMFA